MTIQNLLLDFSVAQCFAFIYRAAVGANDYRDRERVSRQQAANSMVTRMQRAGDRARAEHWDVTGYGRPKGLPRSQWSHTLHDVFMKTGQAGFYECIEKLALPRLIGADRVD
jgi:hypothetical protein